MRLSLAHFSTRLSVFFLFICRISLCILDVSSLPDMSVVNIFYSVEIKSLDVSSETLYSIAHSRSLLGHVKLYIAKWTSCFWILHLPTFTYPFLKLSPNQKLAPFFIQLPRPILLISFYLYHKRQITYRKYIKINAWFNK